MNDFEEKFVLLGLNIAHYRKLKGLTQEELAARIFISREQLSRIESPNNSFSTSISTIFAIAEALDIEEKQLFDFRR